jgi:hypothetical protein
MKMNRSSKTAPACFLTVVLMAAAAATGVNAQTDLQGRIVSRPLTPGEIANYKLPADTEVSGGQLTRGVGQPFYLEADVNNAISATNTIAVTWALTDKPAGSMAALTTSPLGTNVPVYGPSDQLVFQAAGRTLLRADVAGQYTVAATITAADGTTTNLTQTLTAGTYMGINTCALCHSGGLVTPNKVVPWSQTAHAHIFTDGINGVLGSHYSQSCLPCHTVGYDTNTNAVDGGFDDVAKQLGWTFPTSLQPTNFASLPPALQNLGNIQCENCHGPGSQHAASLGDTNLITVSLSSGDCNQCHDAPTHHIKGTEWYASLHASTTRDPSGPGRESCVGCHTGLGFIQRMSGKGITDPTYVPINCQACHEPHGETVPAGNPHLIRALTAVTFQDGTTVTNAGEGQLCMQCHQARVDAATYATSYHSHFGPHHGPQGDMIEGVNGFTYGQDIPSSAHRTAVTNLCVTCHMQTVAPTDTAFLHAGGHTFRPDWEPGGTNVDVDLVGACQQCHGKAVTDFNFPLQDYDGDGVIDGVQTEVQHLMDRLAMLLPPIGQAKTTVTPDSSWTAPQMEAAYNYLFVQEDGSMGIHNTAYTVGLLKASIANLTGDANHDSLPDAWQIQYFGAINNPDAAPDASPAGDGVPNWLKYALGLDPTKPGVSVPGGVVWANGKNLVNPPVNPGETNTVEIYTAAEVVFNTVTNASYQIQAIGSLGGGWQNVGDAIPGTGNPVSYVTPTRSNAQMFFRVVHSDAFFTP